jgi:hypothetical protein
VHSLRLQGFRARVGCGRTEDAFAAALRACGATARQSDVLCLIGPR